ncbi:cell wall metabolism sensor histidine kinase WalK [Frankia sp. R43]|uniref:sensor histidine kinase n=1 Tax=Frankia sp. R43 TaxID=269536 RepID=UPI0007C6D3EB|nr:HAMP domain-containing sensor histidine kinase [Frankia sp. R43]
MSIRTRLLLALVMLIGAGLSLAALGTHSAIEGYLADRLDQQVRAAQPLVERALARPSEPGADSGAGMDPDSDGDIDREYLASDKDHDYPRFGTAYLVGTYGALFDADDRRVAEVRPNPGGTSGQAPRPDVPGSLLDEARRQPGGSGQLTAVPAVGGGDRFRVLAVSRDPGQVLVVAVPYTAMDATLDDIWRIEVVASLIVAAATAALGYVVVRLGLRPLEQMERTADAIAAGDLTRRVANAGPRTEAGRLGRALNTMLAQIEAAFRQRESSENRLRQFVADASHELRTPLTSIQGYAEMFHRGVADRPDDLALAMRRIESEAARMSELVDDLLLLAGLDQGTRRRPEPVDLAAVVRDVVADARAVDPTRTITVEVAPLLEITGDEPRLRQAVGNLVRNALVHTPAGTPVEVEAVRSGDGWAVVTVADHGPGIAPEDVPHIFERFYRADAGRSREAGGTGLGLSIVDAVMRSHGGGADHSATPGGGSTFRLRIPEVPRPTP